MAKLETKYLGLTLKNPLVVSACPLTSDVDYLRRLEEAGAAAAVLPSLFEEQIEHEETELHRLFERQTESFAESLDYFPEMEDYNTGPDDYLHHIEAAKQVIGIPLIASLNGSSAGGWIRYARLIEEAGADALELNIYIVPTDPNLTAHDVEQRYVELVASVRESIKIPIAVKIGPYFSALPNFARKLVEAGADGLVLFNRYLEPDIDLETLEIRPKLELSTRHEVRVPLRWIAILRDQLATSLAATSGIHFADDVIKVLLAGADVAMIASVLMRYGPSALTKLQGELEYWLEEREYESVAQLRGSMSRANCPNPANLDRSNYMHALINFTDKQELDQVVNRE
ncbi:MAG: dihydroorotate dehydrogenase-like protein [Pirellulaceae bacterium]